MSATSKRKTDMEENKKSLPELIAFNRRNFIKLIIGGAAGIHITPLPWKLMDDSAIWTQNWPWMPVPETGEFNHVKSVCTLCPGGCGIEVRKVDDRPVKIEGRTDYPVNPGGLCPLGVGGLQLLYNENARFTGPMKRVGPRGSGEYVSISWGEALNELSERIKGLRKEGRPDSLAAVDGNPSRSSMSLLIQRFLEAVGSPNYLRIPNVEDTYALVNRLMQGNQGPMAYDLENAGFVLSFGCGLIEGWGAPGRMINAWRLWRSGPPTKWVKIVQVEARASNTASKADEWIAPLPGTEAALALGLAHVMIKEGLYDKSFVKDHCFGFEDWTDDDGKSRKGFKSLVLEKYSPRDVAEITGLDANLIISLANVFARADKPIALFGKGKGYMNGSLFEFMAIHSLNALAGNINKPGGVLVHDPLPLSAWAEVKRDAFANAGLKKPRLDGAGSANYPFTTSHITNFSKAVGKAGEAGVDTLLVFASNPAHNLPDGGAFMKALQKIPYIVSFSPYKDETALMADLILPDHTYLEKVDDIVWPTGIQYPLYGLTKPVLYPLYDTKNSGDVIIRLAKKISKFVGAIFPWKSFEAALKDRAKGLFYADGGITSHEDAPPVWKGFGQRRAVKSKYKSFDDMWKKIKSEGFWYRPTHDFGKWATVFKTPTGKFEFYSKGIELAAGESALDEMGIGAKGDEAMMPHYEPANSEVDDKRFPLRMIPYSLINLASGWTSSPPYLYKTLTDSQLLKAESFAEINPQTAAEYGLKEGDRIIVTSPKGEARVRVNLFEGAMPGIVFLPLGLGHTAFDAFQQDKGANPNKIIDSREDPLSGLPVWWETRVRITKA